VRSCAFLVGSNTFSGPITSTPTALLRERFSKISKKIEGRAVKNRTARENRKLSQAARGLESFDFCETGSLGARPGTPGNINLLLTKFEVRIVN